MNSFSIRLTCTPMAPVLFRFLSPSEPTADGGETPKVMVEVRRVPVRLPERPPVDIPVYHDGASVVEQKSITAGHERFAWFAVRSPQQRETGLQIRDLPPIIGFFQVDLPFGDTLILVQPDIGP